MDKIIAIDKPKNYTSRDIVNIVCKKYNTKKVGHAGTLDPIATGLLIISIGKYTKLIELLTNHDKEYIARVILGIETDMLDITGKIEKESNKLVTKEEIIKVLSKYKGKIIQEVPSYSAIKINGKKLYEYARKNEKVELPKREVEIYNLELINDIEKIDNRIEFEIKCHVSKGTYIRSLIRDIGRELGTYATMKELRRIKQGNVTINDSMTIEDLENDKLKDIDIFKILNMEKIVIKDESMLKKIKNGVYVDKFFNNKEAIILDENNNMIAIYKEYDKNKTKPWKMF